MSDLFDWLLTPFRSIFDWLTGMLTLVSIDLPPVLVQGLLVALAMVGCWYARGRSRVPKITPVERGVWKFGFSVLAILGLAVLVDWSSQLAFPLPKAVRGAIQSDSPASALQSCLYATHVELLDRRRQKVVTNSGRPDSQTGAFELKYEPEFSNPPRFLLLVSTCFDSLEVPVTRRELRLRQSFAVPAHFRGPQ